jgi:hypothetical protein
MAKNGAVLHQSVAKKYLLAVEDIFLRVEHRSRGIDDATRNGRFARIGPIGEEAQNEKAKKNHYGNGLKPRLRNQQISLQRLWAILIRHAYPREVSF